MDQFVEGIIACAGILGGLCAFNFWIFGLMEKRIEHKLDTVCLDVARIANELREERRSKDALYKFVLDNYEKKD